MIERSLFIVRDDDQIEQDFDEQHNFADEKSQLLVDDTDV